MARQRDLATRGREIRREPRHTSVRSRSLSRHRRHSGRTARFAPKAPSENAPADGSVGRRMDLEVGWRASSVTSASQAYGVAGTPPNGGPAKLQSGWPGYRII